MKNGWDVAEIAKQNVRWWLTTNELVVQRVGR